MTLWQNHLEQSIQTILLDSAAIAAKVKQLAEQINRDYQDIEQDLLVIGILRGSAVFMADLIRELALPLTIDFMMLSSYGSSTTSSGNVQIVKDTGEDIAGKHILIVEDIIDSGLTLSHLCQVLQQRGPASMKICTLLDKPSRRKTDFCADYIGFSIPDHFVVGYGLDFNGHYRHLPYIGVLVPEAYE